MSSIPAAALPVVPFLTVPRTVPASAAASGARTSAPSKANRTEHQRRFILKACLHCFEVTFRVFSGTILKTQVAQIVIDGVAALQQLVQLCPMRRKIRGVRLNVKNEKH